MNIKTPRNKSSRKEEKGLTMVLALFLGMILISGVTGLMLRQLMARKLGSSESYQQMAENAAINGFNRILGELNRDSDTNYKGYFLTLRNDEDSWGWRDPNTSMICNPDDKDCNPNDPNSANLPPLKPDTSLAELCTDTSFSLTADPLRSPKADGSYDPKDTPTVLLETSSAIPTQRDDGKGDIQLLYRLRGYALAGDGTGNDEGTFQIEGIVQRKADADADEGDKTKYLARTLLTRSLFINQRVAGEGDWAVLGGYYMRLGNTAITGPGKILLDVSNASQFQAMNGCSPANLRSSVGSTNDAMASRIWPVLDRGLPTMSLFEQGKAKDTMNSDSSRIRVWNFDDSGTATDRCDEVVCVRREDETTFETPAGIVQTGSTIVIKQEDICPGSSSFECHMYVEHINLSNTKILIETGTAGNARPVVIHPERPKTSSAAIPGYAGNITLSGSSLLCGVNNGDTSCNEKPERFVISASAGNEDLSCGATSHVLDFAGDSLPHAIVHLQKGTVRPSAAANLHGVIWARNICTSDIAFTLKTSNSGKSVVEQANTLWQWEENRFPGYGQMVVRGIRGTGLDTFRRW